MINVVSGYDFRLTHVFLILMNLDFCRKDRQFKVAIKLASKPDLDTLQQFLRSRHMEAPQDIIQVLDVVLRSSPSEKYISALNFIVSLYYYSDFMMH